MKENLHVTQLIWRASPFTESSNDDRQFNLSCIASFSVFMPYPKTYCSIMSSLFLRDFFRINKALFEKKNIWITSNTIYTLTYLITDRSTLLVRTLKTIPGSETGKGGKSFRSRKKDNQHFAPFVCRFDIRESFWNVHRAIWYIKVMIVPCIIDFVGDIKEPRGFILSWSLVVNRYPYRLISSLGKK